MRLYVFIAILCALAGCGAETRTVAPTETQIVRLADSEAKGLDPQHITDLASLRIAADQFEGLTRFTASGVTEPGLAARWDVLSDGLIWRFTLKQDLKFSDGKAITAGHFVKLFTRLTDPSKPTPNAALFSIINSVTSPSDGQVEIQLNAPFPALPELLAHPAMSALPVHEIAKHGERWTSQRPVVTSGPYRLTTWHLNDYIRLEPNPNWHDGKPPTPNIIWKAMDNSLSAMRLTVAGGADMASDYPASRHQWLNQNRPGLARSTPYLGAYYYAFNTRKKPFNDRRIRIALSMAIDRHWISEELLGIGNPPAWGILPDGLSGLKQYQPKWARWSREKRLKKAKTLLNEAGFNASRPLKFEIRFNSSPEHRRIAVTMSSIWREIGVETTLFNSEAALHFASLRRNDFTIARSGWIADLPVPENFLTVHRSDAGPSNYSGYSNPDYDAALEAALQTADPEKRAQKMRDAEILLIEDMPILPIYFYVTRSLVAPRITGWKDNPSNVHPSRTLSIRE